MHIAVSILLILVGAAAGAALIWLLMETQKWKGEAEGAQYAHATLVETVRQLEKDKAVAETELAYLKTQVDLWIHRPVQAILNDQQFQLLYNLLEARVRFNQMDPEEKKPH